MPLEALLLQLVLTNGAANINFSQLDLCAFDKNGKVYKKFVHDGKYKTPLRSTDSVWNFFSMAKL
jgi:hypothetical protein